VTHDQEEALTMSDRIAVMSAGKVQQVGTPTDIYERPVNRFVADFIGDTNLIDVTVSERLPNGDAVCTTAQGLSIRCQCAGDPKVGETAHVSIRPEKIRLIETVRGNEDHAEKLQCRVDKFIYLGTDTLCLVSLDDGSQLTVRNQNAHGGKLHLRPGSAATLDIDAGAARLLVD
jgi:spermidine/putrescine transport system ATP-binding protein